MASVAGIQSGGSNPLEENILDWAYTYFTANLFFHFPFPSGKINKFIFSDFISWTWHNLWPPLPLTMLRPLFRQCFLPFWIQMSGECNNSNKMCRTRWLVPDSVSTFRMWDCSIRPLCSSIPICWCWTAGSGPWPCRWINNDSNNNPLKVLYQFLAMFRSQRVQHRVLLIQQRQLLWRRNVLLPKWWVLCTCREFRGYGGGKNSSAKRCKNGL